LLQFPDSKSNFASTLPYRSFLKFFPLPLGPFKEYDLYPDHDLSVEQHFIPSYQLQLPADRRKGNKLTKNIHLYHAANKPTLKLIIVCSNIARILKKYESYTVFYEASIGFGF
jgi:hypothetical protein